MIAFDGEVRDGAKQIGLFAMLGKMLDCLVDQYARLPPRAFFAEQRHEGRLARIGVLPDRLARCLSIAGVVDEVVGDLERETEVARITAIGSAPLVRAASP